MRKILAGTLIAILMFAISGCSGKQVKVQEETGKETAAFPDESDMFSKRDSDTDYSEEDSVKLTLNGESVTISEEGTYIISGTIANGMIKVEADKKSKIHLVFKGVSVNNDTSAALYIVSADKVFVTLAEGTENILSSGDEFVQTDENNVDGTVFSKDDLTFNGSGDLKINSGAGHGIVCKDELAIMGGNYVITAKKHGIDVNDAVKISDGTFSITSGKDAIHSDNEDDTTAGYVYIAGGKFEITSEGDGISASGCIQINDGEYVITAGGGSANGSKDRTDDIWGNMGGHMWGNKGGDMPEGMESMEKPDNMPEGMESMERPDNMPEGMESMEKPDNMPEGMESMEKPDNMPEGMESAEKPDNMSGGMQFGEKPGNTPGGINQGNSGTIQDFGGESSTSADSESTKGVKADGSIKISGGSFKIDSADDGIHSDASIEILGGTYEIASGDDGIHGDDSVEIKAGTINITECYEGIEAVDVKISGGTISITADDDGINSAGSSDGNTMFGGGMQAGNGTILISGGTINVTASGDGIDANGSLEITGGYITVTGPTTGDTATLDFDRTGVITGGTFIGTGASGMAQTFSDSEQGVVSVKTEKCTAGTLITLKDADGNVIISHSPEMDYEIVIISCPELKKGGQYVLTIGDSSETVEAS